ncbi:hypothetical protein MTO96_040241 [Rhipicephalus appendiculatus]
MNTSVSEHLRHSRCPEKRGPCDFYCLIGGYLLGYCELGLQKCHCVSSAAIGAFEGIYYYKDANRVVKAYERMFGCPKLAGCAIRCLLDGADFSVCNINPPYRCFCYFSRQSQHLPQNIKALLPGPAK